MSTATTNNNNSNTSGDSIGPMPVVPDNYPCGRKAQTILRKSLKDSQDPQQTITEIAQQHSLHQYICKAFGTQPLENKPSSSPQQKRTTRGEIQQLQEEESQGLIREEFQPESVFTFCNYLGISKYEMHKAIADQLKTALEYEIDKIDLSKNKSALLDLLQSSFRFINVPELRSVFVTVMKKMGDETPEQLLVLLASRSKKNQNELKHGDLLQSLGLDLKRLVYEADWCASIRMDGMNAKDGNLPGNISTLDGGKLFSDIIKPFVNMYVTHDSLKKAANLAYTDIFREKRLNTNHRRAIQLQTKTNPIHARKTGKLSALTGSGNTGSTLSANNNAVEEEQKNVTGVALNEIKEVMGNRPKLLAAVLNLLISEHGKNVDLKSKDDDVSMRLVQGEAFLHCTMLSDILLSYGQLPRDYEDVRLLAQILDKNVCNGIISDQDIIQIQKTIKTIFQSNQDTEQSNVVNAAKIPQKANTKKNKKKTVSPSSIVARSEAERQFELKLLRKIIEAAIVQMKENDPQGLFLNPVTDDIAPNYSKVIKNPMCIRTIEEKALNLRYDTLGKYEIDVQLMFQNCIKYNIGKEGNWFRGEARRQQKKWKDEILSQSKDGYNREMKKRRTQLENALDAQTSAASKALEESKKKEIMEKQRELLQRANKQRVGEKRKADVISAGNPTSSNSTEISPLPATVEKKKRKEMSIPSMPAIASMLLADPFVVRLLYDKILRAIKKDVLNKSSIPSDHSTIPSILQLINIANLSSKVCAVRGKTFVVPNGGLFDQSRDSEGNENVHISEPFVILRQQIPKLTNLLLTIDIDKRILSGDLQILSPLPDTQNEEWNDKSNVSKRVLLDLVEGSLVHLIQGGISNEMALLKQCPRFFVAINNLSQGDMTSELCFFTALTHALLRYKMKLPHSIRDMIVEGWMSWMSKCEMENITTSYLHSCFIALLLEWSSFGNVLLPVDTLLEWLSMAVKICEEKSKESFATSWEKNEVEFSPIKSMYEEVFKGLPEDRAQKLRESIGIAQTSENTNDSVMVVDN